MDVNTQGAIIAAGFVVSMVILLVTVALLFGLFEDCCSCRPGCPDDMDEWLCCLTCQWLFYRVCPCCARDWRHKMRRDLEEMREKLNASGAEEQPPPVLRVAE